MVFFYRSLRAQPSIPCYNTSVWAVQRAQYHNPTPHWTPDMISDVSYRSLETHRSPCDQRRTRGCTSDKKRAAGGYLVPQPSPTCLARTVQPASARPEPSLGLAAAAVVRLVPAGGGRKRRGWAAVPCAAASRSLHAHTRPCCPMRWGASAAASTRVCSHLRGILVHHREERQTGVRGRAAACRSARGRRPAPSLGLHRPLAPSHTGAHASSRSESQGRLGAGRSWQHRSFLAHWGWLGYQVPAGSAHLVAGTSSRASLVTRCVSRSV